VQLDGILLMEGEGEPSEIAKMKRDLRTLAEDAAEAMPKEPGVTALSTARCDRRRRAPRALAR
jgi:hypothetical protein